MTSVKLYTTAWCPYCHAAKALLDQKGVAYDEIPISKSSSEWQELTAKTRMYTVPQIFIGERFIGGFDEMRALDRRGDLDPLLSDSA
ncbi:MAG: glutaredoxin 3 [Planctomycetota bacterium]